MHSIRTKLTALTIVAMLVILLSVGSMGIYAVRTQGNRQTAQNMSLICDNYRGILNQYFNSVEQSVDMVTRYISETLSGVDLLEGGVIGARGDGKAIREDETSEQQLRLDAHLNAHTEMVRTVFRSVANHTSGVITYYYRINPEVSRNVEGFLFSRIGGVQFSAIPLTPLADYEPDDISHVGWYYIPIQRGRPSWIGPYYNDNLGVQMVSYVTPIYKSGTFIGVVGMDISYETLVSQIQDLRILESGYAVLTDAEGNIVYHPEMSIGESMADAGPALSGALERLRSEKQSGANLVRYTYHGVTKQMYFNTLSNGMRLLVVAPEKEIHAVTMRLINRITLAGFLFLFLFSALMAVTTKHITEPLQRLTVASKHLAEGDYRVNFTYHSNDEVGILTSAFERLVEHLRIYINDLNSRAYQDALTGVKNKGAYNVSAQILNDAIRLSPADRKPEFAVIMLDCNDLKKVNDKYGHEKGDLYLQTACELICKVFVHSPVFRMGGDEFAVILQKDDYYIRNDLLTRFDIYAQQINAEAAFPWEEAHIAKGMADYEPGKDIGVESVFQRADEAMYEDKKRCKALRLA
ncbi:MAG: diguanylate cyclase [Oscillibacter sp.]|nr:diguanylate cyclase [Oscillibacter sp.]